MRYKIKWFIRYDRYTSVSAHLISGSLRALVVSLLFLCGCQSYHPLPLDSTAVENALKVPTEQALCVDANSLRHPVIPSVALKFSDGLSPDEAAVLAVLVNPSLRAQRDKRKIAAAQLIEAGLLPNPQFDFSLETPTGGNKEGEINAYGLGLNWDVTALLTRSTQMGAAEKEKASIDLDIAWQEWQIAEAAKTAVYDLFSLQNQLALAIQSDRTFKENLSTVQKAFDAELMTELDLSAAQTASRQAHAGVLELRKQVSDQNLTVKQILGLNVDADLTLQKDMKFPLLGKIPTAAVLLTDLEKRRLDLAALRLGYESQQDRLRAAILNQFPRVNVGLIQARDTGNVVTTGFGVTIDLPVFNRNQGQIAIERATRQQLFDEYVDRVFETRTTVAKLSSHIPVIIDQIKTVQAIIASSKKLVETYRMAVDEGQADVLSYYTAWNDLNDKQIEMIKLKQELVDARIALELETGRYNLDDAETPTVIPDSEEKKEVVK